MKRLWRRLLWRIGWLKLRPNAWRFPIVEPVVLRGGIADGSLIWVRQGGREVIFPRFRRDGTFCEIRYRDAAAKADGRRVFWITPESLAACEEQDRGVSAGIDP